LHYKIINANVRQGLKASNGASYSNLFTMLLQLHPIKRSTPTQRSLSLVSILKVFGIENSMIVVPKKWGEYWKWISKSLVSFNQPLTKCKQFSYFATLSFFERTSPKKKPSNFHVCFFFLKPQKLKMIFKLVAC
jgi:hypothetical protein